MERKANLKLLPKYTTCIIYLLLILIALYLCFGKLDVASLQHWDEARHGVNAYEMLKNNNFIVNTYNYENDYFNLKPPLSYWGIILGFKIFGVSIFSMRFYSAASLFLTFIIVAYYMHKKYGKIASISSMMLFISCSDLFFRHAGRNADADALFILLFTLAMLFMLHSPKHPRFIYACGFLFSLAFLTKSWHALLMLAIGGLFFVFSALWKKLKAINYILFFLCSFGPIAFWAYIRYQYDGMAFLGQMFGVDVTQRISDSAGHNTGYSFFTKYLLNYLPTLFMIFAIILLLIYLIYNKKIKYSVDMLGFLLWAAVPLIIYDLSHTYYYWYIFPVYIPLIMTTGILLQKLYNLFAEKQKIFCFIILLPILFTLINCHNTVCEMKTLETSGFQNDLKHAMESHSQYHSMEIYVEKNDNEYKESYYWEQSGLLAAELSGDLFCKEGGIQAFLKADSMKEALLITDLNTYEENKEKLSNHTIIYLNEYVILK